LKRNTYYRHLDKNASLFDEQKNNESLSDRVTIIKKTVNIPIDQLDFRYGAVAFRFKIPEVQAELEFEIENDEIRPEFDVLKPYFSKVLKSKKVQVDIHVEFEHRKLISQMAVSDGVDHINREIIESAKFRFLEKSISGRNYSPATEENLLNIKGVQDGQNGNGFYSSEEALLNDLLKNENVKHYRNLRYLASKHDGSVCKLRFVLEPFSFVFLLRGAEQYHIVLETLDTEEATYVWHIDKSRYVFPEIIRAIDQDLNIIRNKGRQHFLENHPENFSRIIHDYSEERKGFVIWRDLLEERLL
jgi:hypothetical protein